MTFRTRQHRESLNHQGHAHELTFGCYHGFRLLKQDEYCQWLAESIAKVQRESAMAVWAYVFMPNHVHLIVHFGAAAYEISRVLREIKSPVSRKALANLRSTSPRWIAKLTAQRGLKTEYHFWQRGGGYDRNITDPTTLERMMDYIHLNPVRSGLTERASDWKWSSAQWYEKGTGPLPVTPIPPEWIVTRTDQ